MLVRNANIVMYSIMTCHGRFLTSVNTISGQSNFERDVKCTTMFLLLISTTDGTFSSRKLEIFTESFPVEYSGVEYRTARTGSTVTTKTGI